jgi:hypothetical protein
MVNAVHFIVALRLNALHTQHDEPHMEHRPRIELTQVNVRWAENHALWRNDPEPMLRPSRAR